MSVGWRDLAALEARAARRRRAGLLARPLARAALGGAAGAAAAIGFARWTSPGQARAAWMVAALVLAAVLVMGAPFRMFWRPDASLLGRLPIEGKQLYRLGFWRGARVGAWLGAALALAALPLFVGAPGTMLRLVALGWGFLACAALAAPVCASAAGAIVVSAKAQALIKELSSGQAAPGVVWLSLLPAAGGLAVAWSGWRAAHGASAPILLGATATACSIAFELGGLLAARTLAAATREVAALDAVKLAHVDRTRARGLERLWGRLLAAPARLVYEKDVAMLRRRHPGYYLVTGLGIGALWLVAALAPAPARDQVALAGVGALCAYVVLLARRLTIPPTEQPRLLGTLPLPARAAARGKRAYLVLRTLWVVLVAGAPAIARSPRPLPLAAGVALAALATVALGVAATRRPSEPR